MLLLPVAAAVGASLGWASGIVLAQQPARRLGAFEFTRIQLTACAALVSLLSAGLGYWSAIPWHHWPSFLLSAVFGILAGNLAMIECLRRGGPRRTELLLALRGPVVALMAYLWFGETLNLWDVAGGLIVISGIWLSVQFSGPETSRSDRVSGSLGIVVLLGLFAVVSQGFGFLVVKPAMAEGMPPLAVSAVRLLGAAFLISIIGLWPAEAFRPGEKLTPSLLGRTILPGFIGYVVSSSLLLYAFANFHAGLAAVLGSLSPVLVLPILWVREGRAPAPRAVFGAVAAIVGTAIIVLT
ncbi:DMT family transporter [Roseibium aggregatum]|uniref:DMT family transporter n=1 Tax=Roseibium aggregatum TaxID=187304 RepID=A0A939J058_9HYPH|nr:DMT family transporter [Roseibium aggregatum]MBN9670766.1 DMT family transporter [Roseibium aggregatum]